MLFVYAGCGLALLFFAHLLRRYREYLYAKAHPGKSTNGIDHKYIVKNFANYTIKTIDFCLTFFVLVPVGIYLLSYLPFVDNFHPGLFDRMLANQTSMFNYHSGLEATHPYSSSWYEWPTMVRPIWYYSSYVTDAVKEGISVMTFPKARKDGTVAEFSRKAEEMTVRNVLLLYLGILLVLMVWIQPILGVLAFAAAAFSFLYYHHKAMKYFGGITGDLAGYFLCLCEVTMAIVLAIASVWV